MSIFYKGKHRVAAGDLSTYQRSGGPVTPGYVSRRRLGCTEPVTTPNAPAPSEAVTERLSVPVIPGPDGATLPTSLNIAPRQQKRLTEPLILDLRRVTAQDRLAGDITGEFELIGASA